MDVGYLASQRGQLRQFGVPKLWLILFRFHNTPRCLGLKDLTPRRGGGIKDRTPSKLRQGYVGQGRQAVELGEMSYAACLDDFSCSDRTNWTERAASSSRSALPRRSR